MRSRDEVLVVAELFEAGYAPAEIARRTGIPSTTVRNWCGGRTPRLDAVRATCARCGQACLPVGEETHEAYAYLLGQYLGDGGIYTHRRDVHRLVIFGDAKYPGIASEVSAAIATVAPQVKVRQQLRGRGRSCLAVDAYSRRWPCLFPQHGAGPKHERPIELALWQADITERHPEALIRGLIHSDGCRAVNTIGSKCKTYRYPRYQFSNRSDDIRAIFCQHLDILGIPWRRMNRWNISIARREGVARLDEFVGPKR